MSLDEPGASGTRRVGSERRLPIVMGVAVISLTIAVIRLRQQEDHVATPAGSSSESAHPSQLTREFFGYPAHLMAIDDRLFLSIAMKAEGTETYPAGVWSGVGGQTWTHLQLGDESEIRAVADAGDLILLAGRAGSSDGDGIIWGATEAWLP